MSVIEELAELRCRCRTLIPRVPDYRLSPERRNEKKQIIDIESRLYILSKNIKQETIEAREWI